MIQKNSKIQAELENIHNTVKDAFTNYLSFLSVNTNVTQRNNALNSLKIQITISNSCYEAILNQSRAKEIFNTKMKAFISDMNSFNKNNKYPKEFIEAYVSILKQEESRKNTLTVQKSPDIFAKLMPQKENERVLGSILNNVQQKLSCPENKKSYKPTSDKEKYIELKKAEERCDILKLIEEKQQNRNQLDQEIKDLKTRLNTLSEKPDEIFNRIIDNEKNIKVHSNYLYNEEKKGNNNKTIQNNRFDRPENKSSSIFLRKNNR